MANGLPCPRLRALSGRVLLFALFAVFALAEASPSAALPVSPDDGGPSTRAPVFLPLTAVAPRLPDWTQVNAPGFGEHAGPYTGQEGFDLTVFNDRLYLGMEGLSCARIWRSGVSEPAGQAGWEQVISNGFDGGKADCTATPPPTDNDHIDSLEPFRGYLYASTAMQNGDKRGSQVWRSATGDAGTWVQVNVPGFGTHTNENFKDMIEYDGLLCGGTMNKGSAQIPPGAQVWCTDGIAPDPTHPGRLRWVQRNLDGFGDPGNVIIWSSAVYGGSLYFGVEALQEEKLQGDGSVWRTRNIRDPNAWAQVFSPADVGMHASRVELLDQLDDQLYIGVVTPDGDAVILRSRSGDRYTWEATVTGGLGTPPPARFTSDSATVLDGVLYVALFDTVHGTGIWRTADGTTWMRAAAPGFGDPANVLAELIAFDGDVYAWTSNYAVGQGVWRGHVGP